jgi:hypothetical protein
LDAVFETLTAVAEPGIRSVRIKKTIWQNPLSTVLPQKEQIDMRLPKHNPGIERRPIHAQALIAVTREWSFSPGV